MLLLGVRKEVLKIMSFRYFAVTKEAQSETNLYDKKKHSKHKIIRREWEMFEEVIMS